ncbi:MAG: (2Fe-2S) ferredoxin domain-containing protein [Myxococcales bacterium]|nr:(2Fe-2S) ferredoxin domain-containing protein [Polyangiaceae bacterium]MDW8248977.1 (2Fe-2S) ferredoxin domain-containing protein [Myxococcales bacterium]
MPQRKRYIFVCNNRRPEGAPKGSCAARGSEQVHAALKSALASRGMAVHAARACTCSCLDVCSQGVTILVEPDHLFLGKVTVEDIPSLVDALQNDTPLPDHLVLTREQIDQG